VDRGKYGSKIHLITERSGLPLSVGVPGANVHDSQALIPLVQGIPPIRSRRGRRRRKPGKLHGDKGYDYDHLRRSCCKSKLFTQTLTAAGIAHKRIRTYRPQTNGKVERFNRTLLAEWAYLRPYTSNTERTEALADFLHTCNHHHCHTALAGHPPISRVNNATGHYT
jgi:hypothetical protein